MANSVDPDQTTPIGAVCSGSMLFASILNSVSTVRQLFAADDFSRRHFQMLFFLGALRVKISLAFWINRVCNCCQSKLCEDSECDHG